MRNYESYIWPGGILNRINRTTSRGNGGNHIVTSNTNFHGQVTAGGSGIPAYSGIRRVLNEPPTERSLQDGVKETDV